MRVPKTVDHRLSARALNRSTLHRQLLLQRKTMPALAALEGLAGMQAQAANAPYVGLWSRLHNFAAEELSRAVLERTAVRAPLMRGTIHLVTAGDCLRWRPVVQCVLERGFKSNMYAKMVRGVDALAVLENAVEILAAKPQTRAEFGLILQQRWPEHDAAGLAYLVTSFLPLVQVPPRGVWGQTGPAAWATVAGWLGEPVASHDAADELVLRYLGAFGPATVADMQAWCGLTKLSEVVARLRPQLKEMRSENGALFYDLADGTVADPDWPAPPRFLPEYDNTLFAYADRTRFNPGGYPIPLLPGNGGTRGTLLLDGHYAGKWEVRREGARACLTIETFVPIDGAQRDAAHAEGLGVLQFIAPDSQGRDVRLRTSA